MAEARPCRVQWVTRAGDMSDIVERLRSSGGTLLGRSGYDVATEDLDVINDRETGRLSIAEFRIDPLAFSRQVVATSNRLGADETLLIDLTGSRPKVQLLPVPSENGVVVRQHDGLRRFPRSSAGFGRHNSRWLAGQLVNGGER